MMAFRTATTATADPRIAAAKRRNVMGASMVARRPVRDGLSGRVDLVRDAAVEAGDVVLHVVTVVAGELVLVGRDDGPGRADLDAEIAPHAARQIDLEALVA